VLETAREHEDKVPPSVRRVMVSLIALGTILVTVLVKLAGTCGYPGTAL